MKCMFKSFVSLIIVFLMVVGTMCPALAEHTSSSMLKPYLTAEEAVRLVEIVLGTKVEYMVEDGILILNDENVREVDSAYEEGYYRIDEIFEAAEKLQNRHDWMYTEAGVSALLTGMGVKAHVKVSDDASYLLVMVNDGEYTLVIPVEGRNSDDTAYTVEANHCHELICWAIAVANPASGTFYDKLQRENNHWLDAYVSADELNWIVRTLAPDLKIWFEEDGQVTLVDGAEVAILPAYAEEGSYDYRLDEVLNAVDNAVTGNTFYTQYGMKKILKAMGYKKISTEMSMDGEFVFIKIDGEKFTVNVSHQETFGEDEIQPVFNSMDFYDALFWHIVGEDFSYEVEE